MRQHVQRPYKWTFEKVIAHVKERGYTTKREWVQGSAGCHQTARNNGWVDAVIAECGLSADHKRKWDSIQAVIDTVTARGFKTLIEWSEKDHKSYSAAKRNRWTAKVIVACGIERQHKDWSDICAEDVIALVKSKGYRTKVEWIKDDVASYGMARQLGWLDPSLQHAD